LFCTSRSLWWVVCSSSVSWKLSVDVSIVAFLTLHVSSLFWQTEIFAKPFFQWRLNIRPTGCYGALYTTASTSINQQTLLASFAERITKIRLFFETKIYAVSSCTWRVLYVIDSRTHLWRVYR
jgi:hypothetical protein